MDLLCINFTIFKRALGASRLLIPSLLLSILFCQQSFGDQSVKQGFEVDDTLRTLLKSAVAESDSFIDRFDAEVWLMSKTKPISRFVKDTEKGLDLLRLIHRHAKQADLPPEIVLAVIEIESGFDRFALSHAGAQGMMQVMPFWKHEIGRPEDNLINLETNLKYGCTILKHYLEKSEGRLAEALARYNGSYGSYRYSEKVMDAWQEHWL